MINYIEKLKNKLAQGKVVPVAGAGVSYATASLPSWWGLVASGLDYAEDVSMDSREIARGRELLNQSKLTEAAGIVKTLLNAPKRPYVNWLEDTLGNPHVKSELLIESIQNLCQPLIATTNYDDLLRNVGTIETDLALDWQQHEEIHRCLVSERAFIFHLHGIYTRPNTAVFSEADYKRLKKAVAYKYILQDLWMNRTFLFIGCSRDGIMDEDFSTLLKLMREWFPNISGEHYLLVKDSEIGSASQRELMEECNVHMITYGSDHENLPDFINSINPNAEVIIKRYEKRKAKVFDGLSKILALQHETDRQSEVETFVRENLGAPHYWLDNDQLKVFQDAAESYNMLVNDKQQQFKNKQLIARAMVNVSQLQENIELWNQNWRSTEKINNVDYINMGIFAYQALQKFSNEVLRDIELRHPNVIHPNFFNGHLTQFYREALDWKARNGELKEFDGDDYFFENLKRIMQSLKSVLSLSPNELYEEKRPAKLAKKLDAELLILIEKSAVTLNQSIVPFKILAELPWQDRLDFTDAKLITYHNRKMIVACNSLNCMLWDPCNDLNPKIFYSAQKQDKIWEIQVIQDGDDVLLNVFTEKLCLTIANFSEVNISKLGRGFSDYVRVKWSGKTYCTVGLSPGLKQNSVFEYRSGEYLPVVSSEMIFGYWKELGSFFPNNVHISEYTDMESKMSLQDVTLSRVDWLDGERLVLRCRMEHKVGPSSTVLFFFDPNTGFDQPLLTILFQHKNCFTFDTGFEGEHINMIAGFLDMYETGNLIQFFEHIESSKLIIAKDQPGAIPQDLMRTKTRDMFNAIYIDCNRALVLEEGKKIQQVSLPDLSVTEVTLPKMINTMLYYN